MTNNYNQEKQPSMSSKLRRWLFAFSTMLICLFAGSAFSQSCTGVPSAAGVASASLASVCPNSTVALTVLGASTNAGIQYQWYQSTTAGGPYTAVALANDTVYNTGSMAFSTYYVMAVKCVATGDSVLTNEVGVTVMPALPASVSLAASSTNVCAGTSVTITATPTNGGTPSYVFYVNTVLVQSGSSDSYTYTPANGDVVTGQMTSNATCVTGSPASSNSISITVNNSTASISGATSFCTGTSTTLTASSGVSYLWSDNSTGSSLTVNTAGTYSVTITDANGCTSFASINVTVNAPAAPTGLACYQTASFNTTSCAWDVTGTQPAMPTLACYETASFNTGSCSWVVTGTPIVVSTITPSTAVVGATVTLTGSGLTGATGVSFNGTAAVSYTVVSSTSITVTVPAGAINGPITVTVGGCSGVSGGSFTLQTNVTFNLKAYMQGYYAGSGLMSAALMNQGVGTNANVTDDITVELRDQFDPTIVVATASTQINTDGTASVTYPGTVLGGNYYVAVFNRTTLPTWSDIITISTSDQTYDFTTAANKAYGDNQIEVETGVYAFYSGDVFQDEFVDIFDQIQLDNDLFDGLSGYYATDLNGDGYIDIFDQIILDNNLFLGVGAIHP